MIRRWMRIAAVLISTTCLAQTPPQPQQTWFTIAHDGDSISIPAGTSLRYGAMAGTPYGCGTGDSLKADAWAILTANGTAATVTSSELGVTDPAQCYVKELDVLETATAQSVTVNGVAVAIPAQAHILVLSAVYPPPSNTSGTWFGGSYLPLNGANDTWESTRFTVTIDGQTMICDFQPDAYKPNTFTFACSASATAQPSQ